MRASPRPFDVAIGKAGKQIAVYARKMFGIFGGEEQFVEMECVTEELEQEESAGKLGTEADRYERIQKEKKRWQKLYGGV